MIFPSAIDVMRAIQQTHDTVLCPSLTGSMARSAGATVSHLLRHVALRLEKEGQILADDIALARALLADMREYLSGLTDAGAHTSAIDAVLQRTFRAAGAYPSLTSMAEEAGALRAAITDGLEILQSVRSLRRADPDYAAIREKITFYIVAQIGREAELIEPAFANHGARR